MSDDKLRKVVKDSGTCEPAYPGDDLIKPGEEAPNPRPGEKTKIPVIRQDGKLNNDGTNAR